MKGQLTITDMEYAGRKKMTKREKFLDHMNAIIPWQKWIDLIAPFYPSVKMNPL